MHQPTAHFYIEKEREMKYNTGDKFIIEIEKIRKEGGDWPYTMNNGAIVSDEWISHLTQLVDDVPENLSYDKGMEDAWKMAQRIYKPVNEGGISGSDIKRYFGCSVDDIYKLSIQEVAKALKQYEEDRNLDWSKVPVDTPVLVRIKGGTWVKRYFARYEDGIYYTFDNGSTSWSAFMEVPYEEAKLAEV